MPTQICLCMVFVYYYDFFDRNLFPSVFCCMINNRWTDMNHKNVFTIKKFWANSIDPIFV